MAHTFAFTPPGVLPCHTRCVLGWAASNTMDMTLCLDALERARHTPEECRRY